jgi:UDP-N-acetylglucosamine 2-epimerase (non-hydrolysing)
VKIACVVGARPNFVKIAPLLRAVQAVPAVAPVLVHTGQHYDDAMAGQLFRDLELPAPAASLGVGSGSHAYQTAEVMRRLEPVLAGLRPDLAVVVGDVNSTLAAALTAAKLGIPVAHVEAGLRSFDRRMPEELNRVATDAVSDYLFATEESGRENLRREGKPEDRIFLVGNVMIDTLERFRPAWQRSDIRARLGLESTPYGVVTLHRPANVDDPAVLDDVEQALAEVSRELPLVFPVHPRTRARLGDPAGAPAAAGPAGGPVGDKGIHYLDPLGYLDFIALVAGARVVLTDSGGLQEETTALGVPCLTLRENTERPVTIERGTNRLVGTSRARIVREAYRAIEEPPGARSRPPLWDGRAAERIVAVLRERLAGAGRR